VKANDELIKLLKPISRMREEQFAEAGIKFGVWQPDLSAEKIDYLLGSTLGVYRYIIQKHYSDAEEMTYDPSPPAALNSQKIDFYGGFHCWKMNQLIDALVFESKRTGIEIRPSLLKELVNKQLEFCRLMTTYSDPGDIWQRSFNTAFAIAELLSPDSNPGIILTQLASDQCLHPSEASKFSFPRFSGGGFWRYRFGLGIQNFLEVSGCKSDSAEPGTLRAIIDEEKNAIISISYETEVGTYYRDHGFWWEFLDNAEEYFDSFATCFVYPKFVEFYDSRGFGYPFISTKEMLPFVIPGDELWG
jgi:hypothetical protein